ncbi:hypothetical protein PV08_02270 [Exophiala spinifera]|uniref:ABC transporter n=1 Tax=Exophiala spinifera TaxID=91928 RepID=A0A0D2C312_9EURO|nr:uncharacterized protein PV08_02270 [Exophiala spinifera]KIW17984.1 hypothetical protein PV08_02270 [Exophiala spinifera]
MANTTLNAADSLFGPVVKPISGTFFDFTRLFEESIFSIGPSAALMLIAPVRIWYLRKTPRKVVRDRLALSKLVLLATLLVLEVINLGMWAAPSAQSLRTRASIPAASLSFAATLGLACLSYTEHMRSITPSLIINLYLLLTLPLDFAQVRSLWLRGADSAVTPIFTSVTSIKACLLLVEAIEKASLLLPPFKSSSPESTSGIYSRALFWWLNPLFLLGYKTILSDDNLFVTDPKLMSKSVFHRFQRHWAKYQATGGKGSLRTALARTMLLPFSTAILPRLLVVLFRFMQPFLIRDVSRFVAEPVTSHSTSQGWALAAAYGLVYLGLAISQAIYYHQTYRMVTMTRGALVAAIYAKAIELPTTALDESAPVTLMSTDVQRVCDSLAQLHETWASIIEVALGIWLLTREIGFSVFGPVVITVVSVLATVAVSKRMPTAQKLWLKSIQTRIGVTSKMLQSMKGVKMLGLTPYMSTLIQSLREHEILLSLKSRRLQATCIVLANVAQAIAPGVAFILYVVIPRNGDQTLDVAQAYTSLSLIALITRPVASLIFAAPPLRASLGCIERIQSFLFSRTRTDNRLITKSSPAKDNRKSSRTSGQAMELQPVTPTVDPSRNRQAPIRLLNATFAWSATHSPVVEDISFELPPGSLTFLLGPVGCGKSSLLKGILGEIPSSKGFVYLESPETAFVQQTPWIQDKTFRDNILGTSPFDAKWYRAVITACALDDDIAEFLKGDLTVVGAAGHGLSGGQRLRLALARAIYPRPSTLILDDTFSGLDAESEGTIFRSLLGKGGLLRQLGTTILLATHAAHRLSYADYIIVLSAQGTISEEGTFSELMSSEGYISILAARHKPEVESVTLENKILSRNSKPANENRGDYSQEMVPTLGDIQVYKYYFGAIGWLNTAAFVCLIMSFAFFSRFPDAWMKFWTSAVATHGNSISGKYVTVYFSIGVMALVSVLGVAFHVYSKMVPASARYLHLTLLSTVMAAPLSFFTSVQTGQILNRFSQDLGLVDNELPSALIQVSGPFFLCLVQIIFICLSAAYFVTILPLVLLVLYFLQKYYLRTSRQIRLLDLEAKAPLYSHFLETLQGLVTIRAFGWAKEFEEQNMDLLDKSQKPFYLLFCIQRWLSLVLDIIVAALAVILMIIVVELRDKLDPALVALALLNIMSFNSNLTAIIQMWTGLETSMGAISRLKTFNQSTSSEDRAEECSPLPETWPSGGHVEFSGLSATYAHELPNVIKDIDLTIAPGERLGICGTSGSGKSSLITSLFRMLEITNGTIYIDGIDLSTISRQRIRERLNAIPQDPFFLKGTIRQNIDPFGKVTDEAIELVLCKVGLWATVSTAPYGLDSEMEAEELLSHGQRQLFCLARAMLNPSKIVVLDEVTASVDLQTDRLMQEIIRESFAGRTLIIVAHRLQTLIDCDRIVVMQFGRIAEVGAPDTLLATPNGYFRHLWNT